MSPVQSRANAAGEASANGPPGCPNYALISLRFYELLK